MPAISLEAAFWERPNWVGCFLMIMIDNGNINISKQFEIRAAIFFRVLNICSLYTTIQTIFFKNQHPMADPVCFSVCAHEVHGLNIAWIDRLCWLVCFLPASHNQVWYWKMYQYFIYILIWCIYIRVSRVSLNFNNRPCHQGGHYCRTKCPIGILPISSSWNDFNVLIRLCSWENYNWQICLYLNVLEYALFPAVMISIRRTKIHFVTCLYF